MTSSDCDFTGGAFDGYLLPIRDDRMIIKRVAAEPSRVFYPGEEPPGWGPVTWTVWTYRRVAFYRFDLVEEEAEP